VRSLDVQFANILIEQWTVHAELLIAALLLSSVVKSVEVGSIMLTTVLSLHPLYQEMRDLGNLRTVGILPKEGKTRITETPNLTPLIWETWRLDRLVIQSVAPHLHLSRTLTVPLTHQGI
jgi:hypothetical protein